MFAVRSTSLPSVGPSWFQRSCELSLLTSRLTDTSTRKLVFIHPWRRSSVPEVAQETGCGEDRSLSGKPGLPQLCASLINSR